MKSEVLILEIGLATELLGAFVLSIEAIGLERVSNWAARLRLTDAELRGNRRAQSPSMRLGLPGTLLGLSAAFGSYLGARFGIPIVESTLAHQHRTLSVIIASILGGLISVAALQIEAILLLAIATGLSILERKTRSRSTGIIGFLLLAAGIVTQMYAAMLTM